MVLVSDDLAEGLFGQSAQVTEGVLLNAGFFEELDSFFEVELNDGLDTPEFSVGVLGVDDLEFARVALLQAFEHRDEHVAEDVEDLPVVVLELHLHIETGELTQMTVGVGVFSPENWSNLEYTLKVTTEGHLLV